MSGNVWVKSGHVHSMPVNGAATSATGTATGNAHYKDAPQTTFQGIVAGTGVVTATIIIDCSNDGTNWCSTALGTITLSGTTSATDGFTTSAPWKYVRARVTAISGTGAVVTVLRGV
jgi:hypothetical protein